MHSKTTTFEALRVAVEAAIPATSHAERRISWVGEQQRLAFARDDEGQLELFLLGDPLSAQEHIVRERLVHNAWQTLGGSLLAANRLRLPEGDHYDAIAAAILLELVDKGYEQDAEDAFRRTESLIALALEPARAESTILTGLAGELYTLVSMIRLDPTSSEAHLDAWQGWGRSSRDFQLGSRGVEVKTSTTSASRHHIQGWYQVECGVAADGTVETELFLLSIGIQWLATSSAGMTVELLAQEVINVVPENRRADFLDMLRHYGGARLLFDDDGVAGQASLRRPFIPTYERLYDLQDERVSLPRSADLAKFSNLISDSVQFEIELPDHVRGDRNPVVGMSKALSQVLNS